MSELKKSLLIRLLPQTDLGRSVASFLVDRQARGLSPHTVDFYASELHYLQAYLEKRGIPSMQDTSADLLRRYLTQTETDLEQAHRKAGPVDNTL